MNSKNINFDGSRSIDTTYNLVTFLSQKYNIPKPSDEDFTNSPQKENINYNNIKLAKKFIDRIIKYNNINKEQLDKIFSVISGKRKKDK